MNSPEKIEVPEIGLDSFQPPTANAALPANDNNDPDETAAAQPANNEPATTMAVPPSPFPTERQARKAATPSGQITLAGLESLENKGVDDLAKFFQKGHTNPWDTEMSNHLSSAWSKHIDIVRSSGRVVDANHIILACIDLLNDTIYDLQSQCHDRETRASKRKSAVMDGSGK